LHYSFTRGQRKSSGENAQKCRFPGTVVADDRETVSGPYYEVDVVEHSTVGKTDGSTANDAFTMRTPCGDGRGLQILR